MNPLYFKFFACIGIATGLFSVPFLVREADFPPTRMLLSYVDWANVRLIFLNAKWSGVRMVATHVTAATLTATGATIAAVNGLFHYGYAAGAVVFVVAVPFVYLKREYTKRITQIEKQMEGFLLGYANALKAVPNIGAALAAVEPLLQEPIRYEIQTVLREVRVGCSIEDALKAFARRVKSSIVDDGLSALLIGLQVGGDLTKVLTETAATLRELERLEGLLKSKTAEAKFQMLILGCAPMVVLYGFDRGMPGYFKPLQQSVTGYMASAAAVILWIAALVIAHMILDVDI